MTTTTYSYLKALTHDPALKQIARIHGYIYATSAIVLAIKLIFHVL